MGELSYGETEARCVCGNFGCVCPSVRHQDHATTSLGSRGPVPIVVGRPRCPQSPGDESPPPWGLASSSTMAALPVQGPLLRPGPVARGVASHTGAWPVARGVASSSRACPGTEGGARCPGQLPPCGHFRRAAASASATASGSAGCRRRRRRHGLKVTAGERGPAPPARRHRPRSARPAPRRAR